MVKTKWVELFIIQGDRKWCIYSVQSALQCAGINLMCNIIHTQHFHRLSDGRGNHAGHRLLIEGSPFFLGVLVSLRSYIVCEVRFGHSKVKTFPESDLKRAPLSRAVMGSESCSRTLGH